MLNTIALYVKIAIKAIVLLVSTRIVIGVLGASDYGLYNLIAGVISLLSFLSGSLLISTQRYLSIALGEKNTEKLSIIFNSSLFIHILITILLTAVFLIARPLLFNGFLNIDSSSVPIATNIYNIMIISMIVTISTIPFSAVMNAHEDMIPYSVAEIIALLTQLLAAIIISVIDTNHLVIYTWLMMLSFVVSFLVKFVWCKLKYAETKLSLKKATNIPMIKKMFGFVGWNTLGSAAVVVRNQGVAVVLNHFFGTLANAAYGVANQVNSFVLTFSTTLTTVFTPSIIQSKGEGNDEKMLFLAQFSSKLSFLLSSIIAIPVIWNMDLILRLWLKKIPINTEVFIFFIIMTFLVTQLYPGINRAIYATGKIKGYQIAVSSCLIATIPLGMLCFQMGMPIYSILCLLIVTQTLAFISTIYYAHRYVGLNLKNFILSTALPCVVLCAFAILLKYIPFISHLDEYIVLGISIVISALYTILFYQFILREEERSILTNLFKPIAHKLIK